MLWVGMESRDFCQVIACPTLSPLSLAQDIGAHWTWHCGSADSCPFPQDDLGRGAWYASGIVPGSRWVWSVGAVAFLTSLVYTPE